MNNLWMVVLGMGLVTYFPRFLPMVLLQNISLNPFLDRFLKFIPFAALGALIFPGVLESTGSLPSAICGMVVAMILALFRINLMIVVIAAITGVLVWELYS